jgi:carbonic anhydrase/acetyltransferase-like protein (isoleucine patch superfamily)
MMPLARPSISPSAFIGPNGTIWGDVTINDNAVLMPGVVIRAELASVYIGSESNLQDNVVCHVDAGFPLMVGNRVTVGHQAMLHGCTIGDGALIGIGAIVLNGAVIGEGAMVAAGALVPEGREIPAGMLAVGSPAKVIRPVGEELAQKIDSGVEHYLSSARTYREAGLG